MRTDARGVIATNGLPPGFGPKQLRSAYRIAHFSATRGFGTTIAVIDAFDDPKALSDVNVYRARYSLPLLRYCNPKAIRKSVKPCFSKTNQLGRTRYPAREASWASEISLDLDVVSAMCPNCNILLVEANNASLADLAVSVDAAVRLGAKVVNNSYSTTEIASETRYDKYYDHPGIAITVSSGDSGYGAEYPASSPYVTAVGGTVLTPAPPTARGWEERAWPGGGSGCSKYERKPAWQSDGGCARRTTVDVAADAAPLTGVAVYDSTPYRGTTGWHILGGTSVASAIVAAVYALAGNVSRTKFGSYPYQHASGLFTVTAGRNGTCGNYLCTAGPGYNGPTGVGTPDGITAF
jgi:subtilase family serine protease